MNLEFKRLSEVDPAEIISLNTDPLVLRHMPLGKGDFDHARCREWVKEKEAQWALHGYGPWAFLVNNRFVGWGGLQYENGDPDLALVLRPDCWGMGQMIYRKIVRIAFTELGLDSITLLLPPTRTKIKGIFRLGFQLDGDTELDGEHFVRYRLYAPGR